MDLNEFVKNFIKQFDDIDENLVNAQTEFHSLDEWGSLVGLATLNMIFKKYSVRISPTELSKSKTVEDLYNLVCSKQ